MSEPSSFSIVAGDPTPAEVAAVTAVVTAALEEFAEAQERDTAPVTSAWQRSQRPVRTPIERGRGTWRGFSG
ncbi:uncharacterized protein (DUF1800 family) [Conyzicola lurida]|uniref:Uncharacterized protein (DUF1800 family) n=1 Tax=Conyzicola lurida TaxID=1172621 RepID=A0A841AS46_9MICO|nr:uncharacterized protein (DUF1800 family) [Conyzicola lurida]